MTHTPGPWVACNDGWYPWADAWEIRSRRGSIAWTTSDARFPNRDEADARLIAAAPDLLAALQAFADHFGPLSDNTMLHDDARSCFKLARAAIAKATGGP